MLVAGLQSRRKSVGRQEPQEGVNFVSFVGGLKLRAHGHEPYQHLHQSYLLLPGYELVPQATELVDAHRMIVVALVRGRRGRVLQIPLQSHEHDDEDEKIDFRLAADKNRVALLVAVGMLGNGNLLENLSPAKPGAEKHAEEGLTVLPNF